MSSGVRGSSRNHGPPRGCRGENSRFTTSEDIRSVLDVRTQRADERIRAGAGGSAIGSHLLYAALGSVGVCTALMVSAMGDTTPLGAPRYWPWLLTGLQVIALWSAGSGRWWGWLLGGSVQLPWIAYAVVTTQFGFVPGCAISASVQIHNFVRNGLPAAQLPAPRPVIGARTSRPTEVIP